MNLNCCFVLCNSGTPVDCVSLALSGALFSWSKPMLVSVYFVPLEIMRVIDCSREKGMKIYG